MRVAMSYLSADQFEDTKVVFRNTKTEGQTTQWLKEKTKTTITYKMQHKKTNELKH
jgi:predicted transcriptional regulator